MTLRFSERHVMALNLLLIAVLAYFLALSANDLILGGASKDAGPVQAHAAVHPGTANHPRTYYDIIARRDIFNLIPQTAAPPTEVATNLHIRLIGVSQLTLARPFIIVEDDSTHQQSLYRLGDDIPSAGKLLSVESDRAVIEHQGRRLALEMPKDLDVAAPPISTLTPAIPLFGKGILSGKPGPHGKPGRDFRRNLLPGLRGSINTGVRQVGADRWMVDRTTLDNKLNNMSQLFTQIRAVPNIGDDGKTEGFRLSEIQQGSLFQKMGLRDGDILTTVDGHPINDPAKAIQFVSSLRDKPSITLKLLRDGQPRVLNYTIR